MKLEELSAAMRAGTQGRWEVCPPRWPGDTDAASVICDEAGGSIGEMGAGNPEMATEQEVANAASVVAAHNAWPAIERVLLAAKKWTEEADSASDAEGLKLTVDLMDAVKELETNQ